MAITVEHMTEMAMNLRLSKQASEMLRQRAIKAGQDVSTVASSIIEQAVIQPKAQEPVLTSPHESAVATSADNETIDLAEETLTYNSVPPRRSYTVQVALVHGGRGVPAPFELDPE